MRVPPDVSGYRTSTLRIQRDGTPGVWRHTLRSSLALTTLACIACGAYGAVADTRSVNAPAAGAADTLGLLRAGGELRWGADAQGGAPDVRRRHERDLRRPRPRLLRLRPPRRADHPLLRRDRPDVPRAGRDVRRGTIRGRGASRRRRARRGGRRRARDPRAERRLATHL